VRFGRTTICGGFAIVVAAIGLAAQSRPASNLPSETRWTLSLESTLAAPPRFAGALGFFSLDGDRLVAYELSLGTRLWIASARSLQRPAIGDGLIYLDGGTRIAALRQTDGVEVWQAPVEDALAAPLTWDNGWLIAVTTSGRVLAYRASDGGVIWQRSFDVAAAAQAALAADRVYLPLVDGRLIALHVASGDIVWELRIGGVPQEILALDDRLYVGSGGEAFYFYCVTSGGRVDWRWPLGGATVGVPALDARRLYLASKDNVLRAIDRRNGALRWTRAMPLRPTSGPVLLRDILLLAGVAPTLRAYATDNGDPVGEVRAAGDLVAPPHLVPDPVRPSLILVTGDLAGGAQVRALSRRVEPPPVPIKPLPDAVHVPPLTAR
jgi:outer membrane protein assembly factor BamB